ncbi:unnamed protein product, partial [Sphagnum balticum]
VQRLLGVLGVHCVAHRLNLVCGVGLECVPLAVLLNTLAHVISSDTFAVLMSTAQSEHRPDVPILKLRNVSAQRLVLASCILRHDCSGHRLPLVVVLRPVGNTRAHVAVDRTVVDGIET